MESFLPILIPLIIIVVVALAIYGWMQEKKQREALAALASELGWRFDPGHDRQHDDEYAHFEIFRKGHSRSAFNTLTGSMQILGRSAPCKAGDFRYRVTSGSGKDRRTRTYRFSYLIVHLPYPNIPDMMIRREGVFDKVAGFFGFDDIDFESAEFSRQYFVKGKDTRFTYDIIDARMMEFLMHTKPPAVDIELGRMCVSDGKTRWSPEEYRQMIGWVNAFFEHWPRHVVDGLQSAMR